MGAGIACAPCCEGREAEADSPTSRVVQPDSRMPVLLGGGGGAQPSRADKLRPLLRDMEDDFEVFGGPTAVLDVDGLASIWKRLAERKLGGPLGEEDSKLIEKSARVYHKIIDVDRSGRVSFPEFVAFMMGGLEPRGPLKDMHHKVCAITEKAPRLLPELVKRFREWDTDGDGYLSSQDLHGLPHGPGRGLVESHFIQMLEAADVDGDGRLDLWELIAYSIGRKKTAVELVLYDVSNGASRYVSPVLLGRQFEAIYHSGVLAYGHEFWYGGKLFMNEPPCKCFEPPLAKSAVARLQPSSYNVGLKVVHLGYTFVTEDEFTRFLTSEMLSKYNSANYDVLTHNCNCFCNDVVRFLTGNSIPDEILNMPQQVMHTPGAKLLRPLLNRWLGGFGESGAVEEAVQLGARESGGDENAAGADALLPEGTIVLVEEGLGLSAPRVARVKSHQGASVDLRLYDPQQSEFVAEASVPRSALRRMESDVGKPKPRITQL